MRGDSLKERILRVATIEEVVAAYVPLRAADAGYVGLCLSMQTMPSFVARPSGKTVFQMFRLRRRRRLVRFRAEDRGMFVYGSDGKTGETVFD